MAFSSPHLPYLNSSNGGGGPNGITAEQRFTAGRCGCCPDADSVEAVLCIHLSTEDTTRSAEHSAQSAENECLLAAPVHPGASSQRQRCPRRIRRQALPQFRHVCACRKGVGESWPGRYPHPGLKCGPVKEVHATEEHSMAHSSLRRIRRASWSAELQGATPLARSGVGLARPYEDVLTAEGLPSEQRAALKSPHPRSHNHRRSPHTLRPATALILSRGNLA